MENDTYRTTVRHNLLRRKAYGSTGGAKDVSDALADEVLEEICEGFA